MRFAKGGMQFLARSPDLVISDEDFLDLFGSVFMPLDMGEVIVIPFESRYGHMNIVAYCIYKMLRRYGYRIAGLNV